MLLPSLVPRGTTHHQTKIDAFRISFSGYDPSRQHTARTSPFCINPDAEMPDRDNDPGTHERKLSSRHGVLDAPQHALARITAKTYVLGSHVICSLSVR